MVYFDCSSNNNILINLLDKKKKSNLTFHADEMPELKPVPIKTKGKGFLERYSDVVTFNKKLGNNKRLEI